MRTRHCSQLGKRAHPNAICHVEVPTTVAFCGKKKKKKKKKNPGILCQSILRDRNLEKSHPVFGFLGERKCFKAYFTGTKT